MDNIRRFTSFLNKQPVDRVMTYDYLDNTEILRKYADYDDSKSLSFESLVELNAKAWQNIGVDVTRSIHDPVNHWMAGKVKNWIRFFGVDQNEWEVTQGGETAWISRRPFSNIKELEKNLPNLPVFQEVHDWFQPYLTFVQGVYADHNVAFIGAVEGPLTDAYTYMGMELFSTAIFDAPEIVSHILDCTGLFSAYIAQTFAETSQVPLLFMGEDIAANTGPIFNPNFVRREGLPRWKWIMDPIHEKGMKFLFHTDGRYGKFLDLIFNELGADGLNPIERNGCNDIFEIHEQYPDKFLFGNVCCMHTLPYGTQEDVEDETLELIEKIGPDRVIMIGSSSEVHEHVPAENAAKMYQTVHDYGQYPIDIGRIQNRREQLISSGKLSLRKSNAC